MITARTITGPLCAVALLTCGGSSTMPPPVSGNLRLVPVASGLASPLYLTAPPGDVQRLFIVEQGGTIRVVQNGTLLTTPFLDITNRVACCNEQGLLSVAFHPNYATNGYFYVDYTDLNGDTRVERYKVSADSNVADTASHHLILFVAQPYANHNGGLVLFGPDGMLYIGMGDGGSGGDPENRAQNTDSLLGKLLRIDVNGGDPYVNPPNNPYAAGGGRGEIWAIGLRNPWRYAFDRTAGLLHIADVGQDAWEEVDVEPTSRGGLNYGWRIMEGAHCYNPNPCAADTAGLGLVLPAVEFPHPDGCAVIGGFVYRGTASPSLAGQYFYSDLCGGWIRSFTYGGGGVMSRTSWTLDRSLGTPLSFGEDASRELYVLAADGTVYRLASP